MGEDEDTSFGDLLLLRQILCHTGFWWFFDRLFGPQGSNCGHQTSTLLETLIFKPQVSCVRTSNMRSFVGDCMFHFLPNRKPLEGCLSRKTRCKGMTEELLGEVVWHYLAD